MNTDPSPGGTDAATTPKPVPRTVLASIESRYWRPIEALTTLEALAQDDTFFAAPGAHVGTFSDHGVVHVRDVAARSRLLAHQGNGRLFEARSKRRVEFIADAAFLIAYLHDIGMTPVNPWGRPVHAQFAAQTAFSPGFDDIADHLWMHGAGAVRPRIEQVKAASPFRVPMALVLRELLATAVAHSKSTVSAELLADRTRLQEYLQYVVFTPLALQAAAIGTGRLRVEVGEATPRAESWERYRRAGSDPLVDAFSWVTATQGPLAIFADDVLDAVRVVRAADALRQRGTTLRTSAGFEIFTDRSSGRGVFAMRSADRTRLVFVSDDNPFSGAEANVREAFVTDAGALRISLHRERFASPAVADRLAAQTAALVLDLHADVIESFPHRSPVAPGQADVELVRGDRDAAFVGEVLAAVVGASPPLAGRVALVDEPLAELEPDLREWAASGVPYRPEPDELNELFAQLHARGMNTAEIDPAAAVSEVRRVRLEAGEAVFAAHTKASTVVIPLASGLEVSSLGGYGTKPIPPWIPVGATGVGRGGERNGAVRAAVALDVLAIPATVYLEQWFRPYTVHELRRAMRSWSP